MKIIITLLILSLSTPVFAELTAEEQAQIVDLANFCLIEVPGQKVKDLVTLKRIIFGDDTELRQLLEDYRRNILIPQAQSMIEQADQAKSKAQQELHKLQDMVK